MRNPSSSLPTGITSESSTWMDPTTRWSNRSELQMNTVRFLTLTAAVRCRLRLTRLPCFDRAWTTPWRWTLTTGSRWFTGQMWPHRAAWYAACTSTAAMFRSVEYGDVMLVPVSDLSFEQQISYFVAAYFHLEKTFLWGWQSAATSVWAFFVRSFIVRRSATQTVWPWTGWEETCTGVIRDGTLLRCQSWMEPTGQCWSTAAWGSHVLWQWTYATGKRETKYYWLTASLL